jgi:hypothetical protein
MLFTIFKEYKFSWHKSTLICFGGPKVESTRCSRVKMSLWRTIQQIIPPTHMMNSCHDYISQNSHLMEGYLLKYITKIIQNLGYYASNVKKKSELDSLNLGIIWLMDKKSRSLVKWDVFKFPLVIACNRQKRCDKSTAQRFWTAIVRAMGQRKRSKHTTSISMSHFSS